MAEEPVSVNYITMTKILQFPLEKIDDYGSSHYHWPILRDSEYWISDCLDSQAVQDYFQEGNEMQYVRPQELIDIPEKDIGVSAPIAPAPLKASKSIFHNFQKHLKSLIKRLVTIDKKHGGLRHGAYDLWEIFIAQLSSSKKILYIIFGQEQSQSEASLAKMAEGIPNLEKLLAISSFSQIKQMQSFLRSAVLTKLEPLTKVQLRNHCKMMKLQEFYVYLKHFISQLRKGGLSRRITKECKMRLLANPQSQIP